MKYLAVTIAVFYSFIAAAFLPASFRTQYNQEEKSITTGRIKKSEGSIEYRMPGHIRFEINKPNVVVFVGNPKKTWFYTSPAMEGEPGEVTISGGSTHPILKFFDILAKHGLEKNKSYTVARTSNAVDLDFEKAAQDDFGLKNAKLSFSGKENFLSLKEIAVTLSDGKTIRLQLSKLEANVALPSARFNFEIPANTRKHIQ